jgi:hypothetical protein
MHAPHDHLTAQIARACRLINKEATKALYSDASVEFLFEEDGDAPVVLEFVGLSYLCYMPNLTLHRIDSSGDRSTIALDDCIGVFETSKSLRSLRLDSMLLHLCTEQEYAMEALEASDGPINRFVISRLRDALEAKRVSK